MSKIEEMRAQHSDFVAYECAIHGGTGTGLKMCGSYRAGHDAIMEFMIDGFPALLDKIGRLTSENATLQETVGVAQRERDAAVSEIERYTGCHTCKTQDCFKRDGVLKRNCHWQWRGPQGKE